jgi:hypothetical protein
MTKYVADYMAIAYATTLKIVAKTPGERDHANKVAYLTG